MNACPSMGQPIPTPGGWLYRLRLVGGRVSLLQLQKIQTCLTEGKLEITRRGNLQYRSESLLSVRVIEELQDVGLVGNLETDHLRNIMLSPTCGIDREAMTDLFPVAKRWEDYLAQRRELRYLSPKFSVGFDGGEALSIAALTNDILVRAMGENCCQIILNKTIGITVSSTEVINILDHLAHLYLEFTKLTDTQPRFSKMIASYGIDRLGQKIEEVSIDRKSMPNAHLGLHPQKDNDFYYIGIFLPLGHLSSLQLAQLITVCHRYRIPEVRFTPWRNVVLPFVHRSFSRECCQILSHYHFSFCPPPLAISACAGKDCLASWTDTQTDAQILQYSLADKPLHLHLSGCAKLCAYNSHCDFLAVGCAPNRYYLYHQQQLVAEVGAEELLTNIKKFL